MENAWLRTADQEEASKTNFLCSVFYDFKENVGNANFINVNESLN